MENEESVRIQLSRRHQTPQVRKIMASNGLILNECLEKGSSSTLKGITAKEGVKVELLPKSKEVNEKEKKENFSEGAAPRRPRTVSERFRRRAGSREEERSPCIPMSKSFSAQPKSNGFDHRSVGSSSSTPSSTNPKVKKQSLSQNKGKNLAKSQFKIVSTEDYESTALFPHAVFEQAQIIEMLSVAREELREKMVKKVQLETPTETDKIKCVSLQTPYSTNFENSYRGTLEEIFQAWVNLFYFIINLKINLIRILNSAGTESFRPNIEIETEVVQQAIECVKFFSKLKIKSIVDSLEELHLPYDRIINETQIKDYEERVSSPFLFEMDFMQKKAKEILKQAKKTSPLE